MGVSGVDVVGLPGVAGLGSLAADPAGGGGVADLFGAFVVGACVVGSWWSLCAALAFAGGLAGLAAGVGSELAAVDAGFLDHRIAWRTGPSRVNWERMLASGPRMACSDCVLNCWMCSCQVSSAGSMGTST